MQASDDTTTEETAELEAGEPTERRTSLQRGLRIARLFATPLAIAFAWYTVLDNWGDSETALFNWATILAAVLLAVMTGTWLLSLRFERLRHSLLPLEGGLFVGALVLSFATTGREVDMFGDIVAIALVFGIVTALLLGFVNPLVQGRRRAWMWLGGVVVVCAAAGIVVPAALDWLEGDIGYAEAAEETQSSELLSRVSADGVRLDDTMFATPAALLADGYSSDSMSEVFASGPDPSVDVGPVYVDPGTGESVSAAEVVGGVPGADERRSDWVHAFARPDGSIEVELARTVATGVPGKIQASVRRGTCRGATSGKEVASFEFTATGSGSVTEALSVDVGDLAVGDRLAIVVGTGEALAPVRCRQLLSDPGIVLAMQGAASFEQDCLGELDVPRGQEYLVRESSFQDAACARRFRDYGTLATSLIVPKDQRRDYERCVRAQEEGYSRTERKLRDGSLAVTYADFAYGPCTVYGSMAGTGFGIGYATPAIGGPAVVEPGVAIDPATGLPVAPTAMDPVAAPVAAPVGVAPAAPAAPVAPAAGADVAAAASGTAAEDLGMSQEEFEAKLR